MTTLAPRRIRVLVVDDDVHFRQLMVTALSEEGHLVFTACNGHEALDLLAEQTITVALIDLAMPGMHGMELLRHIQALEDPIECVVVTGAASVGTAVEALRAGAFHYLTKPVDLADLAAIVAKAAAKAQADYDNRMLRETLRRGHIVEAGQSVVAVSQAMKDLFREAREIAMLDEPVLIEGETGVGKEVVANYIHRLSGRSDGPLNTLNCGALPDTMIDAEFFGHLKGAFTGASENRPGIIEVSNGGSLLLDEIGDIAQPAQIRLLRVLEQGLVRRIGATKEIPVDVRILAATHRNLHALIQADRFRADLYHRLVVLRLRIPPLRERREDIVPLAEFFLDQLCTRYGDSAHLAEDAHAPLLGYPWLGNVRELRNVIERAWFASLRDGGNAIGARHLSFLQDDEGRSSPQPAPVAGAVEPPADPHRDEHGRILTMHELELRHLHHVLESCHGNRRRTAELLGIGERSLYRRLQEMVVSGGSQ